MAFPLCQARQRTTWPYAVFGAVLMEELGDLYRVQDPSMAWVVHRTRVDVEVSGRPELAHERSAFH